MFGKEGYMSILSDSANQLGETSQYKHQISQYLSGYHNQGYRTLEGYRMASGRLHWWCCVEVNQTLQRHCRRSRPYEGWNGKNGAQDDNEKPITSDVFRVDKGVKATAPYTYFEVKVIVEGVLIVSDAIGQKVRAVEEDVFYFPKAATSKFCPA